MRHAYLIIAHHEFGILDYLLKALDDDRNDIYIHFDKKVLHLPSLYCKRSQLHILKERIDVRWADFSQVEAEMLLFGTATQHGPYAYYHLLSGVDMPLKSQDYLHIFFKKHSGVEFIGYSQGDLTHQLNRKVRRYHLFPKSFKETSTFIQKIKQLLRKLFLRAQEIIQQERNTDIIFKKGTNWVSITHNFAMLILKNESQIRSIYHHTFCPDEIYKHTLCWGSPFREAIYDLENEENGSQRMIQWVDNQIFDWTLKDLPTLLASDLLFARKFNSQSPELLNKLSDHTRSKL